MTIKQQGGIFGRNPTFNDVEVNSLGIGTPAPTAVDLEIKSSVPRLQLTDSDNSAYTQFLFNTGSFAVDIDPTASGGASKFTVDVDNVRQLELNSSGNLIVETGNLVIGTSGQGIDFSATSGTGTSELFDDYEEGTFTPTMEASGGGSPSSYSVRAGSYTKIGNTVYIMINLAVNAGTLSGDIKVTGLPFSPSEGSSIYTAAYRRWNTAFVSYGLIDSGTSAVRIIKSTNNAISETAVTNSDMLSTDNRNSLIISGCYRTT